MRSMTGYGRGECTLDERRFVAEIKSVNHKYNDITVKLPRFLIKYEDSIKKLVSTQISRGKTDVYISFETQSEKDIKISVNENLADCYVKALGVLKEKYGTPDEITLSLLARIPDVISIDKEIDDDNIWEGLESAVKDALDMIVEMRTREGGSLRENILLKLDVIEKRLKTVEEKAPMSAENYQERLKARLSEIEQLQLDEARIAAEVLIFSDKVCIDEEITRLYSHISQMRGILDEQNPIGRKLDFLVQEMNREVNTMASKSNDIEIINNTIEMKSEIEKIREQIQNLE